MIFVLFSAMRRACPGTNVNVNTGGDDDDWETDADFEVSPLVSFRLSNHLVNTSVDGLLVRRVSCMHPVVSASTLMDC